MGGRLRSGCDGSASVHGGHRTQLDAARRRCADRRPPLNLDPDGQGWLRLTPDVARSGPPYVKGSAIYNVPFTSTDGIQATFQYATYRDPANTSSNPLADGL